MKLSRAQVVLLSTLNEAPREPKKTELVKWVFLVPKETRVGLLPGMYEFVPYRDGLFSIDLYWDLQKLQGLDLVNRRGLALTESGRRLARCVAPPARRR